MILDKLFGKTVDDHGKIILPIMFCVILTSTTFFFFDYKNLDILGHKIHFSLGLLVFPLTFSLTNIMQHKYGELFANTAVRYGFLGDLLMVTIAYLLSSIGERQDYFTIYHQIPVIMTSTFFFVWLSNTVNIALFKYTKSTGFLKFFLAAFISESSISLISIPLMFLENKIHGNPTYSIIAVVLYKMTATLILSVLISFTIKKRPHNSTELQSTMS